MKLFFFSGGRSSRTRILIAAVNAVLMDLKLKLGDSDDGDADDGIGVDEILLMGIMIRSDW